MNTMIDIKTQIYNHFYTRKKHFILGKPQLIINEGKEMFTISADYKGYPAFRVDHGVAHIYFTDVDEIVQFIEKHKHVM